MTREQFLMESIQKAGTPYLNAFDHRYYKATIVNDNLRYLTCSNLDLDDWLKVAAFPSGQYIEVKPEHSPITHGYCTTSAKSNFVWAIHRYFDTKGETNQLPNAVSGLLDAIYNDVQQWILEREKQFNHPRN